MDRNKLNIKAYLQNHTDSVEVTSVNFKEETFTWDYRGHLEDVESFEDAVEFKIISHDSEIQRLKWAISNAYDKIHECEKFNTLDERLLEAKQLLFEAITQ